MYNIPFYLLQTMQTYLSHRTFYVFNENELSSVRPINAGVPQGSILGTVICNLYINYIPFCDNTSLAAYADDKAVLSTSMSVKIAMRNLHLLADKVEKWRLKINTTYRHATEQILIFFKIPQFLRLNTLEFT
jgi:hypothetical protein